MKEGWGGKGNHERGAGRWEEAREKESMRAQEQGFGLPECTACRDLQIRVGAFPELVWPIFTKVGSSFMVKIQLVCKEKENQILT